MRISPPLKRLLALISFVFVAQASTTQAAIIDLELDRPTASIGESVTLDISVGDLGAFAPASLGAFDFTVGYDAALLAFSGYSLGSFLGDFGLTEAIDASSGDLGGGEINLAVVSLLSAAALDALQPGEFILASLTFDVTNLAVDSATKLTLPSLLLGNTAGSPLGTTGNFSTSLVGGTPVPLPGTLLLLLGGLSSCGLVLRSGRRSSKRQ